MIAHEFPYHGSRIRITFSEVGRLKLFRLVPVEGGTFPDEIEDREEIVKILAAYKRHCRVTGTPSTVYLKE